MQAKRTKLVEVETPINDPGPSDQADPGDESDYAEHVQPLTDEEIIALRWYVFGKCPSCGSYVKGWSPGAFNPEKYKYWTDAGIDPLTGHRSDCTEKWRRG